MAFKLIVSVDYNKLDRYEKNCMNYSDALEELMRYLEFKKSKHPSFVSIEWLTS